MYIFLIRDVEWTQNEYKKGWNAKRHLFSAPKILLHFRLEF